jgi:hypothetical protein
MIPEYHPNRYRTAIRFKYGLVILLLSLALFLACDKQPTEGTDPDPITMTQTLGWTGGDFTTDACTGSDGGFWVCGQTTSTPDPSAFVIKTDSRARLEWKQRLDTMGYSEYTSITETPGGLGIAVGRTIHTGKQLGLITAWRSDGSVAWQHTLDDSTAHRLYASDVVCTSGDYIVVSVSIEDEQDRIFYPAVFVFQTTGTHVATYTYDAPASIRGSTGVSHLVSMPDDGLLLFGTTAPQNTVAIRLSAEFEERWQQVYTDPSPVVPGALLGTTDGGFLMSGSRNAESMDIDYTGILWAMDGNGTHLWQTAPFQGQTSRITGLWESLDGGLLLCGTLGGQALIAKADGSGDIVWHRDPGGSGFDSGEFITEQPGGEIVCIGTTRVSGTAEEEVWFVRMDDQGNLREW